MSAITRTVAIIPARGGSKRIPRKNVRPLSGRPLLAWTVSLCLDSGVFDEIVVSTDDAEIADVARSAGAEVPFIRPAALADDFTPTVDVLGHALDELRALDRPADLACCMYPASVFLSPDDLRASLSLVQERPESFVATVVPFEYPIQRAVRLGSDGALEFLQPEFADARSQDLETAWHDAGQFYWGSEALWRDRTPILPNSVGYRVAPGRCVDIDTEDDWEHAQRLHSALLDSRGDHGNR